MLPMAMLTIDLPETPQAQPAYRLAADCPHCGAPLVLRQNRQTGALFTGCSAYPGCAFTEPHDARVQTLSTGLVQAVQTLATQVVQAQAETRRQVAEAQAESQRQRAAERATLDRTVRQLIALAHKPRQHLCYVYASLSRLDFRGLLEKDIVVFEGLIGFLAVKKPTALMMHWWNGGRGGVCGASRSLAGHAAGA